MGYFRIKEDKLPLGEPLTRKEEIMFYIIQSSPGVVDWSPEPSIRETQRSLLAKEIIEYGNSA